MLGTDLDDPWTMSMLIFISMSLSFSAWTSLRYWSTNMTSHYYLLKFPINQQHRIEPMGLKCDNDIFGPNLNDPWTMSMLIFIAMSMSFSAWTSLRYWSTKRSLQYLPLKILINKQHRFKPMGLQGAVKECTRLTLMTLGPCRCSSLFQ